MEIERFCHLLLLEHPEGAEAKRALADLGISINTIETFRIGYSPDRPSRLLSDHLLNAGYGFSTLTKAIGPHSFIRNDNNVLPDYFSGILIPIRDQQRRLCDFWLHPIFASLDEKDGSAWPNYGGSGQDDHETRGYKRLLFPAPSWPQDFNRFDTVLLASSEWEVIALHNAGITNAVCQPRTPCRAGRSALALGRTMIVPWGPHMRRASSVRHLLDMSRGLDDRFRVLVVPDRFRDLAEMVSSDGADAVRVAMNNAIPFHKLFGV
ncbi:MAG: hypothetical protein AAB433_17955 [Nitrospirota bacterium]